MFPASSCIWWWGDGVGVWSEGHQQGWEIEATDRLVLSFTSSWSTEGEIKWGHI